MEYNRVAVDGIPTRRIASCEVVHSEGAMSAVEVLVETAARSSNELDVELYLADITRQIVS
jgi:hypothetical protein